MTTDGQTYCNQNQINTALIPGQESEANVWYYDGTQTYHNIALYTGNSNWYTCSDYVASAYGNWVNTYKQRSPFDKRSLGAWRNFAQGLYLHFLRTGNASDKSAILLLADHSAFAEDWPSTTSSVNNDSACTLTREVAYLLDSLLVEADLGSPQASKIQDATNWSLAYLDKWFISNTCSYMQPFMVGLTTEALINAYQKTSNATLRTQILNTIETAMDQLWQRAWSPSAQVFYYESSNPNNFSAANRGWQHLIDATYAWLWQVTGKSIHLTRGDLIFQTTAQDPQIYSGKQFGQHYRRSFDYVKWRSAPSGTLKPPTRYSP